MDRVGVRDRTLTVAIVGLGPRGLAVLERLLVRLQGTTQRVEVWVFDSHQPGAGRIWRTDQPGWLTKNTIAEQVTIYSGPPDDGPSRPGSGPSLYEWSTSLDPNGYARRKDYGHYLLDAYASFRRSVRWPVTFHEVTARIVEIQASGDGYLLTADNGMNLPLFDKVVCATGHLPHEPSDAEERFADLARRSSGLSYLRGDSVADVELDAIPAQAVVAVIGMGLGFYDVMLSLTVGRGGEFRRDRTGRMTYQPSGQEPRLVAGCRRGLPLLARGHNQKPLHNSWRPRFVTASAEEGAKLDFMEDIWPLIVAEVDHVTPMDLRGEADPLAGLQFASIDEFREHWLDFLRKDVEDARSGNVGNLRKAAHDVIRDLRPTLMRMVNFGGLTPGSHRDDFIRFYQPLNNFLASGPPVERVEQLICLVEAGIIVVAGPRARFTADSAAGRFAVTAESVPGWRVEARVLLDSRIPVPNLRRNADPLIRQMIADGLISEYVNAAGDEQFETGGVAVDPMTRRVISREGRPDPGLYAIGLLTEHTVWFTAVGSGRPNGGMPGYFHEADLIARDVLSSSRTTPPRHRSMPPRRRTPRTTP